MGLSKERQIYLYEQIRPFCQLEYRDYLSTSTRSPGEGAIWQGYWTSTQQAIMFKLLTSRPYKNQGRKSYLPKPIKWTLINCSSNLLCNLPLSFKNCQFTVITVLTLSSKWPVVVTCFAIIVFFFSLNLIKGIPNFQFLGKSQFWPPGPSALFLDRYTCTYSSPFLDLTVGAGAWMMPRPHSLPLHLTTLCLVSPSHQLLWWTVPTLCLHNSCLDRQGT